MVSRSSGLSSSGLGSSHWSRHCIVLLGKTLYFVRSRDKTRPAKTVIFLRSWRNASRTRSEEGRLFLLARREMDLLP